jgi:hypothetical protein
MFLVTCRLNHACKPNVEWYFDYSTDKVRASSNGTRGRERPRPPPMQKRAARFAKILILASSADDDVCVQGYQGRRRYARSLMLLQPWCRI